MSKEVDYDIDSRVRRKVFNVMRPLYLELKKSFETSNDVTTYEKAMSFMNVFSEMIQKANEDIMSINGYIELNVSYEDKIEQYKTVTSDVLHEVTILNGFVNKTNTCLELRKHKVPFMNNDTLDLMLKTTYRLVELNVRTNIIYGNVKSRGIDYLIEASAI